MKVTTHLTALALLLTAIHLPPAFAESEEGKLVGALAERFPGATPNHIAPSPVPGIYEVSLDGELIYVTPDARFAFAGRLFDLQERADLSEPVMAQLRVKTLDSIPEAKMIIFEPEGEAKYTISTFTDVDCPYCRKMHQEMDELLDAGVRVRYLMFPRTAVGSPSYQKAVSVWCADDRNEAMTHAKLGGTPEERECANPVVEHMELARRLGLTGTPMTITETGERLNGYLPPDQLVARLDAAKQAQAE